MASQIINDTEYIGDSLLKINNNFQNLDSAITNIGTSVELLSSNTNTLLIPTDVLLPYNTVQDVRYNYSLAGILGTTSSYFTYFINDMLKTPASIIPTNANWVYAQLILIAPGTFANTQVALYTKPSNSSSWLTVAQTDIRANTAHVAQAWLPVYNGSLDVFTNINLASGSLFKVLGYKI